MKLYTKLLIITLALLLVVPFATASVVNVLPVNDTANQIFFDGVAKYSLSITNNDEVDHIYSWETNPVEWLIDTPASVLIPAGERKILPIDLRPRPSNFRGAGFYVIPLTVSTQGETINSQLTIRIKSLDDRLFSYKPTVALGASMAKVVDPSELVSVQLQIRNRNSLDIDQLSILINGENFEKTDTITLGGLEERTLEYRFDVDNALEPGSYQLDAKLVYEDSVVSEVKKYYDVGSFSSIVRDSNEQSAYFKKTTVNTLTNDGNVLKSVKTNMSIKWYDILFTSVELQATSYDKQSRGVYELAINPQETVTITVVKNYRSLPILALIVLLFVLAYFQFRSPIVINKQTIVTGQDEEGISQMRVRIFVRNRSAHPFYNVRLIDRAPSIADVVAKGGLGVIAPSKIITTEKRGTVIKWDFETIEAYEERIVTYTINARLKIIGHLGLPPTRMKFENQKGKQQTTQSGKSVIGAR